MRGFRFQRKSGREDVRGEGSAAAPEIEDAGRFAPRKPVGGTGIFSVVKNEPEPHAAIRGLEEREPGSREGNFIDRLLLRLIAGDLDLRRVEKLDSGSRLCLVAIAPRGVGVRELDHAIAVPPRVGGIAVVGVIEGPLPRVGIIHLPAKEGDPVAKAEGKLQKISALGDVAKPAGNTALVGKFDLLRKPSLDRGISGRAFETRFLHACGKIDILRIVGRVNPGADGFGAWGRGCGSGVQQGPGGITGPAEQRAVDPHRNHITPIVQQPVHLDRPEPEPRLAQNLPGLELFQARFRLDREADRIPVVGQGRNSRPGDSHLDELSGLHGEGNGRGRIAGAEREFSGERPVELALNADAEILLPAGRLREREGIRIHGRDPANRSGGHLVPELGHRQIPGGQEDRIRSERHHEMAILPKDLAACQIEGANVTGTRDRQAAIFIRRILRGSGQRPDHGDFRAVILPRGRDGNSPADGDFAGARKFFHVPGDPAWRRENRAGDQLLFRPDVGHDRAIFEQVGHHREGGVALGPARTIPDLPLGVPHERAAEGGVHVILDELRGILEIVFRFRQRGRSGGELRAFLIQGPLLRRVFQLRG